MPPTDPSLSEDTLASVRRSLTGASKRPGRDEEPDPSSAGPDLDAATAAPGPAAALDPEQEQPPPAKPKPGTYTAEGDPYTYRVEGDGSVTIMEGPTGTGQKLTSGKAHRAILGQIASGQLKSSGPGVEGLAPDRPGMNAHLDDALESAGSDLGSSTASAVKRNMESRG